MPHRAEQQVVIQSVEERPDIEVQHPVTPPAALPRLPQCLVSRFPRSIAVGVRMKVFFPVPAPVPLSPPFGLPDPPPLVSPADERRRPPWESQLVEPETDDNCPHAMRFQSLYRLSPTLASNASIVWPSIPVPALIGFHLLPGFPDLTFADGKRLRPVHQGLPVAGCPDFPNRIGATPSLQPHYRTFIATTGRSAPVLRIGTLPLVGPPLAVLPWHRSDRFPRSAQEPGSRSRHLCAGRHSVSKQVPSELIPR